MQQNRWRSPVVWAAVLGQIMIVIGALLPDVADTVKLAGFALIEIMTLFGVLNNPTNPKGF